MKEEYPVDDEKVFRVCIELPDGNEQQVQICNREVACIDMVELIWPHIGKSFHLRFQGKCVDDDLKLVDIPCQGVLRFSVQIEEEQIEKKTSALPKPNQQAFVEQKEEEAVRR